MIVNRAVSALRAAAQFNPEVQVAPACILWPDADRQWESAIPRLQAELPELLVLGDYEPSKRIGPAIWLRCAIAGKIAEITIPDGLTPVLCLPGVSRQDLRAVENCPDHLKPLAELQYRGVIWSQVNAKDWTVLAFLKSKEGGLGLDVAQDNETKAAMQLALNRLLDEEVSSLRGKKLDKDYFNTLLTGGDPVRDLLQWLDQGDTFKSGRGENEWKAFVELCKSQFKFNPDKDGQLAAAANLASHDGPWQAVWTRFCEAPKRYLAIPGIIRKAKAPSFDLFTDAKSAGGWPQWNDEQEANLRQSMLNLRNDPPHAARVKLIEMERQHGARRDVVWAEVGEAPLAQALEHLAAMAEITGKNLAGGTLDDMSSGYRNQGWKADSALVEAMAAIDKPQDYEAVAGAIRACYLPWAEESARHLQKVWKEGAKDAAQKDVLEDAVCFLFVDGLRLDCAKRLKEMLEQNGFSVGEKYRWAALPSLTGTGKPAVAPITEFKAFKERPESYDFEPLTQYQFRKALEDDGWKVVGAQDPIPEPLKSPKKVLANRLWCEFGDLDHEGHDRGWKMAKNLNRILEEIQDRVSALTAAGWENVRIVTDHGWLLLPGGLPKIELPSALTENKWGRCASLKSGASTSSVKTFPWYWNPHEHIALADGISCFRNGEEYAHGGLSLQECLLLELTVTSTAGGDARIEFEQIAWKGLRCSVVLKSATAGLLLDIRVHAGDPESSIAAGKKAKPVKEDSTVSAVVEKEEYEGEEAFLVLIDENGQLVAQTSTIVGGGNH